MTLTMMACGINEHNMSQEDIKRIQLRNALKLSFDQSLTDRVERYLEVNHNRIIGNPYFAGASSECIWLYRDGYFIGAVMMSQAVNESIIKFLAEKNKINGYSPNLFVRLGKRNMGLMKIIKELRDKNIISDSCSQSLVRIYKSFRNDIHHMNPKVKTLDFQVLAKKNLADLAIIENEIWGADIVDGKLSPRKPQYWDLNADGRVSVFLRCE